MAEPPPQTVLLTADELVDLPGDGKHREIIEGVLFGAAAPPRPHQNVLLRPTLHVGNLVEETKTGEACFSPIDVRFSAHVLVQPGSRAAGQPDEPYISGERLRLYRGHIMDGPPDVVMEVVSPSNRGDDRTENARLYEKLPSRSMGSSTRRPARSPTSSLAAPSTRTLNRRTVSTAPPSSTASRSTPRCSLPIWTHGRGDGHAANRSPTR